MKRALDLAETLLACAVAGAVWYGLLWLAYRIPGYHPYRPDASGPLAGEAVPVGRFPWPEWTAYLLAFVGVPWLWERARGDRRSPARSTWRTLGFAVPAQWRRQAIIAIGVSAGALAYLVGVASLAHARLVVALGAGNVFFYAVHWGANAVAEETLFRGFMQRRLGRALSLWPAIIIAAAIWAFVGHWRVPAIENLYLRLPVGIALGWLYARSGNSSTSLGGSVLPPIAAHWLINMGVTAGL